MKNLKNAKVLSGLVLSIAFSSLLFTSCKKGNDGPAGATGATGATGTNGANGANGTNGANGNTILSGEGAPAITLGVVGDFYLDTKVTAHYGPKTSAGWGSPVSLVGAQGATGEPGANGTNGTNGADGANGANGANGTNGADGATALVDTFSIYTGDWMPGETVYAQFDNSDAYPYPAKYWKRWISGLTQDILDHGMVILSFTPAKAFEPTQWLPLPYTITGLDANGTRVNYNWSYVTGEHTLRFQFYLTPLANVTYYPAFATSGAGSTQPDLEDFQVPDAQYKVVMLPATVAQQITSITKKQFSNTGRVLSNY